MEALDAVKGNMALVHQAGARTVVHSDDPSGSQRLNQEAAKAMYAGRRIGVRQRSSRGRLCQRRRQVPDGLAVQQHARLFDATPELR